MSQAFDQVFEMKKLLAQPIVIAVVTIFVILFVISLQKTAQKGQVAAENVAVMEEQIDTLTGQIEQAQQALEYESSPLAQEKILRNELLFQRSGEYIIQIPDEAELLENGPDLELKTAWQEWQELLF